MISLANQFHIIYSKKILSFWYVLRRLDIVTFEIVFKNLIRLMKFIKIALIIVIVVQYRTIYTL